MLRLLFFTTVIFAIGGCTRSDFAFGEDWGKRPVYLPIHLLDSIKNLPPQPVELSGTIFLRDSLFFMLEQKKGIHVYQLNNNGDPTALTFFQIPAISDFTLNQDVLYADSWKDLLSIDISDIYNIHLLSRAKDIFQPILYPPMYQGIFECADESKGAIIAWEDSYFDDARCRRTN